MTTVDIDNAVAMIRGSLGKYESINVGLTNGNGDIAIYGGGFNHEKYDYTIVDNRILYAKRNDKTYASVQLENIVSVSIN